MLAFAGFLSGLLVRFEYGLDSLEEIVVDERFVVSLVNGTAVTDQAEVVAVLQEASELRLAERFGRAPACWAGQEAFCGELVEETREREFARGVQLVSAADERATFGIESPWV